MRGRLCVAALGLAAACGSDPANVAGTYAMALTNRANGCAIANWTRGTDRRHGDDGRHPERRVGVRRRPGPGPRSALDALTGGHVFTGTVDGDDVALTITGTRAMSQGACAYTIDADLDATLTGDTLSGSVFYRARTNGAADCGALTGCQSQQDFAGARPPP
jgi:hypothetical protein